MMATTAATTTTATFAEIFFARGVSQLKRLGHVVADETLDGLHLLLSLQEVANDFVFQECIALGFKIRDLVLADGATRLLAVFQHLTVLDQGIVFPFGAFVFQKALNAAPEADEIRMRGNGVAKLERFFVYGRLFGGGFHKIDSSR